MERKFRVIEEVFPAEFMACQPEENEAYNRSARADVLGTPDDKYAFCGEWQEVWAEYYTNYFQTRGYDVWFSVW
jgi:hypothetical protein